MSGGFFTKFAALVHGVPYSVYGNMSLSFTWLLAFFFPKAQLVWFVLSFFFEGLSLRPQPLFFSLELILDHLVNRQVGLEFTIVMTFH